MRYLEMTLMQSCYGMGCMVDWFNQFHQPVVAKSEVDLERIKEVQKNERK